MSPRRVWFLQRVATRTLLVTAAMAGAAARAPLAAQGSAVVDSGTRVRVSIPSPSRRWPFGGGTDQLEGTVRSISADTLSLVVSHVISPIAIPRSVIRKVEISLGPSSRGHAFLGGTIGATVLGLRMYVINQEPKTHHFPQHWQAAVVGAVLGFAGGAWLGGRAPNERWRDARLPD